MLPLDVNVGKLVIYGVFLKCLETIVTLASIISSGKSPFIQFFGSEATVNPAILKFTQGNLYYSLMFLIFDFSSIFFLEKKKKKRNERKNRIRFSSPKLYFLKRLS